MSSRWCKMSKLLVTLQEYCEPLRSPLATGLQQTYSYTAAHRKKLASLPVPCTPWICFSRGLAKFDWFAEFFFPKMTSHVHWWLILKISLKTGSHVFLGKFIRNWDRFEVELVRGRFSSLTNFTSDQLTIGRRLYTFFKSRSILNMVEISSFITVFLRTFLGHYFG